MTSTPKDEREAARAEKRRKAGTRAYTGPQKLLLLAKAGNAAELQGMVSLNIDVNFQDERGMTALHHAAAIGARPCIRILVASGRCNYLLKDLQNRYAFEVAAEWTDDIAVVRLLAKKQRQQAAKKKVKAWSKR